ncbi:hypothetical protein ACIRRH_33520 [Kitasatospora sp. NPDC101235]|uniref:hypothetical protein n=1 Tax=Kitasatospora sp. NPDC101235 TaxID=3364101 RepID=UPI00382CBE26
MTDIREEDVQRLTDLADQLATIRRSLRQTAKRSRSATPDLLARDIGALADYISAASRLRAELSHRTGPAPANYGEDWGPAFAATRTSPVLHKLTELLDDACDLANQSRPRSKYRSHFQSSGLNLRVSAQFVAADKELSQVIATIRRFRTGLGTVRKRELKQERQAVAEPAGPTARMVAARAKARGQASVLAPGPGQASAAAAARRAGASQVVSRPPAPTARPAPAAPRR